MADSSIQIFRAEAEYGFGSADFTDLDFSASTFTGPLGIRGENNLVGGFYPDFSLAALSGCTFEQDVAPPDDPPPPTGDPPFPFGNVYQREFWSMDMQMIRLDSKDFEFTAYDGNDVVLNLSGATVRFTAKWDHFDDDSAAVIKLDNGGLGGVVLTDAANGEGEVNIPKTATSSLPLHRSDLVYDLKVLLTSGKEHTVARGRLIVLPNATSSI